ncbi:hypothetical protein [Rhizobium sp. 21-4511-3d]
MRRILEAPANGRRWFTKYTFMASAAAAVVAATYSPVLAVGGADEFRGRWSRDCGADGTCILDIATSASSNSVEITFSMKGKAAPCHWSVPATYEKSWGGPVAHDPYGNYYFYLTVHEDGRLYSSGTMLPTCGGPPPLDQYYVRDPVAAPQPVSISSTDESATATVDNRAVFDHNGSDTVISPSAGTIIYQKPKRSISATVKPGALLFKSTAPWDPYDDSAIIKGTAYTFKAGCAPAPYEVTGKQQGWHTLILRGAAPVREKNGCGVIGHKMNGNALLKFVSVGD